MLNPIQNLWSVQFSSFRRRSALIYNDEKIGADSIRPDNKRLALKLAELQFPVPSNHRWTSIKQRNTPCTCFYLASSPRAI